MTSLKVGSYTILTIANGPRLPCSPRKRQVGEEHQLTPHRTLNVPLSPILTLVQMPTHLTLYYYPLSVRILKYLIGEVPTLSGKLI